MTAYPAHFESDVVLRNGRTLRIRPVRPEDRDDVLALFQGMSRDSLYMRFFGLRTPDAALRDSPTEVDYESDFGVVGELGGHIAAIAHYFRSKRNPKVAEVAFAIADRAQGCGIGTRLLEKLVDIARTKDIEMFRAEVLPENQKMLDVFLLSGFEVASRSAEGEVSVSFPIAPTDEFTEATAMRSQKAAWASIDSVFSPKSIAVIGASRNAGSLGAAIYQNLRDTGFQGPVYPVNPRAEGMYASLSAIEGPVDLAMIVVPKEHVETVIDDCVAKGVGAVVVITAGFGETGADGRELEQRLLQKVRAAGIRMVGPNCMGVLNTAADVNMHATFSSVFPPRGSLAMSSQSGALGLAILEHAKSLNLGFSTFISVGNKADVSGNDLLQYWAEDPNTEVILLYLESFGNPKKFGEIARRVGMRKPIVAVKAGRSTAGARAASSHTGALATSDTIVDDLFRQSGVIRTQTLEELFDVAALLANQPLPLGRRVGIVTNAGGPGILASDACEGNGLEIPQLSEETQAKLREFLPPAASVGNPVDMIASASADQYRRAVRILLDDPGIDSVLVIYIPVLPTDAEHVSAAIRESGIEARAAGKTVLATFMSVHGTPEALVPVPSYRFPERAVTALARATKYAEWRRAPRGKVVRYDDFDREQLRLLVARCLERGGGWLDPLEANAMLLAANIPTALISSATNVYEAVNAAMRMGFPVVLKAQGPLHKTEAGGVKLGLQDEREVREAYLEMSTRLGDTMTGATVQQMIGGGVEVMVGAVADPMFGHLVVYGAGGTLVELLSDVAFRIHPLTDADVADMLHEVRWSRLLDGFRGAPPSDIPALREVLTRLSALLTVCPEIRELDINPVKVLPNGAAAVDARIRIEPITLSVPTRRISY
ncbi:MAG TPA: GNAT family N-acetyltransferase [Thermoanaerobaculia bacterium]